MRLVACSGKSEVISYMYKIKREVRGNEGDDERGDDDGRDEQKRISRHHQRRRRWDPGV